MIALSLWKVVHCYDFVTTMDGSLVIMECSLLLRFCYSNGWLLCHYERLSVVENFVIPFDGSLVIMEGSLLLRFLLLQRMVAFSL